MSVFQIVKRHYSRYTPEMVEEVTGCPKSTFMQVAETVLANSGRERTTAWSYAVGWTQHTCGPQMIGCCALLQLLLGNIGRPVAGSWPSAGTPRSRARRMFRHSTIVSTVTCHTLGAEKARHLARLLDD